MSETGLQEVREIEPADADALAALFERERVPCYCRYWHFDGTTNDWLDRCAHHASTNRDELTVAVSEARPQMSGVVARGDDRIVGWLKLAPAADVPKLYGQRLYRGLPCFEGQRDGVLTVGCLLVAASWRRRGVARALVEATVEVARRRGARAIEAFPRRAEGVADAELFTGPYGTFAQAGFEVVHDFGPYPVLRRTLP